MYISDRTGLPIDCGPTPAGASVLPASLANAPRVTRAQACLGRTGFQPLFISERTGLPIDCGAGTVVASARAPGVMVQPGGFAPSQAGAAHDPYPGIRRATLAELCHEVALTGARFRNVVTNAPVICAPASPTLTVARTQVAAVPAEQARPRTMLEDLLQPQPAPVSNPVRAQTQNIRPPAGYAPVWDDGRVNLQRGVPQPISGQVLQASRAPLATADPAAAPAHRFIQVGTYGEPANADAAAARLRALGLPVGFATATRNGQSLRIVAAGPFANAADLAAGLQAVRAAGYGDAFPRN